MVGIVVKVHRCLISLSTYSWAANSMEGLVKLQLGKLSDDLVIQAP